MVENPTSVFNHGPVFSMNSTSPAASAAPNRTPTPLVNSLANGVANGYNNLGMNGYRPGGMNGKGTLQDNITASMF